MHALRTKSLLISVVGFLLSVNQSQAEPAAPLAGAKRFKVGGLEVELTPDTGTITFLGPESSALDFTPDEQELKNLRPGFQQLGDVTLRYRRGGEPGRAEAGSQQRRLSLCRVAPRQGQLRILQAGEAMRLDNDHNHLSEVRAYAAEK